MTDARSPRTAAGRALLADAEQNADGESVCLRVALIEADILAIEAEATAGTEDDPMHTDEEYIEYGAVQYQRGRAQAEAEAQAAPPASEQHTITLSRYLTLVDEIASLRALNRERLAMILRQTYTLHFPRAGERDWRSDADYIAAAYDREAGAE